MFSITGFEFRKLNSKVPSKGVQAMQDHGITTEMTRAGSAA